MFVIHFRTNYARKLPISHNMFTYSCQNYDDTAILKRTIFNCARFYREDEAEDRVKKPEQKHKKKRRK